MTRKEYIMEKIASDTAPSSVAVNDRFIQYIQDLALDIYLSLNKPHIMDDTVRYIMTYCPYSIEDDRYAQQYEGTDEQLAKATEYIDMAYFLVYWDMTGDGDVWERYLGQRHQDITWRYITGDNGIQSEKAN